MAAPKESEYQESWQQQLKDLQINYRYDLLDKLKVGCSFTFDGKMYYMTKPTVVLKFVRIPPMIVKSTQSSTEVKPLIQAGEFDIGAPTIKLDPPLKPGDVIIWDELSYLCCGKGEGIVDVSSIFTDHIKFWPTRPGKSTKSK